MIIPLTCKNCGKKGFFAVDLLSPRMPVCRCGAELLDPSEPAEPTDGAAFVERGMYRLAEGNVEAAMADFDEALERAAENVDALLWRANAHLTAGDPLRAITDCDEALRIGGKDGRAHFLRASAHQMLGHSAAALDDYGAVVEKGDDHYREMALVDRSNIHTAQGNADQAEEDCTRAIEIDPEDKKAHLNRGVARIHMGDLDGAIADLTDAIRIDPSYTLAYFNRGNAYRARAHQNRSFMDGLLGLFGSRQDDIDRAVADWRKALETAPPAWPHVQRLKALLAQEGFTP